MTRPPLRALLDHSLFLFLLGGGALFALTAARPGDARIEVDPAVLQARAGAEAARLGVQSLSARQLSEVRTRLVEDEVLFREATRLELDRDDPLVRQRLIQKVLFLAEDLGGASAPATRAELERFFAADPGRWAVPPKTRFVHVFFAARPPASVLTRLTAEYAQASEPPPIGEAFVGSRRAELTAAELTAMLGPEAADEVQALPEGAWAGPIRSRLGFHFVRVLARVPPRAPEFSEVHKALELDYLVERKQAAVKAFLDRARRRYGVDEPLTGRVAPETQE